MPSSKCKVCGKNIPDGSSSTRCNLCSIGLTPAAPGQLGAAFRGSDELASGRVLSGSFCSDCRAELSLADLSMKRCGICGESINLETLNQDIQVRQTRMPTFQPTKHPT